LKALIRRHKQFITVLASLFIILAQFSVLEHATDHPFHQEDAQCISFQSAELNKHLLSAALSVVVNTVFFSDIQTVLTEAVSFSSYSFYSARAPPTAII